MIGGTVEMLEREAFESHLGFEAFALALVERLPRKLQRQRRAFGDFGGQGVGFLEKFRSGNDTIDEADQRLDGGTDGVERDAELSQHPPGDALRLAEQAEQQVLGADVVVAQETGLVLGEHDRMTGPWGEALEHGSDHRAPVNSLALLGSPV